MTLWSRIRRAMLNPAQPDELHPPAVPPPAQPVGEPPYRGGKSGRTASSGLPRTIEILRKRPHISAQDLSVELGVTTAYARTLLRQAHRRPQEQPCVPVPAASRDDISGVVARLEERLAETERALTNLRSVPPYARGDWTLNRRAEVLRLAESGNELVRIAQTLSIPAGEVEFILKIERFLHAAG